MSRTNELVLDCRASNMDVAARDCHHLTSFYQIVSYGHYLQGVLKYHFGLLEFFCFRFSVYSDVCLFSLT